MKLVEQASLTHPDLPVENAHAATFSRDLKRDQSAAFRAPIGHAIRTALALADEFIGEKFRNAIDVCQIHQNT